MGELLILASFAYCLCQNRVHSQQFYLVMVYFLVDGLLTTGCVTDSFSASLFIYLNYPVSVYILCCFRKYLQYIILADGRRSDERHFHA